jgi:hypothetical protein
MPGVLLRSVILETDPGVIAGRVTMRTADDGGPVVVEAIQVLWGSEGPARWRGWMSFDWWSSREGAETGQLASQGMGVSGRRGRWDGGGNSQPWGK